MADSYRALLIGNSLYPKDPGNLPELRGPVNDIGLLRNVLEDREVGMFRQGTVRLCSDRRSQEIAGAMDKFFGQAGRNDVLLLYYSGHGLKDIQENLYLCARDTVSAELGSTAVSSQTINRFIENSAAARIVIILDCCYSGAFKGGSDLGRPLTGEGRYVLHSSRPRELSHDSPDDTQPSAYTRHLIAGIRSATTGGSVDHLTVQELHTYVHDRMVADELGSPLLTCDKAGAGLAIARRPATRRVGDDRSAPTLVVSETSCDLGEAQPGEVLPVERVYVTARQPDGRPASWTATTDAGWVQLTQGHDPERLEVVVRPRLGDTRANIEIRNAATGEVRTVRMKVALRAGVPQSPVPPGVPSAVPPPAASASAVPSGVPSAAASGVPSAAASGVPSAVPSAVSSPAAAPAEAAPDAAEMIDRGNRAAEAGQDAEAETWFRRAAEADDIEGMCFLAHLLYERQNNEAEAARWLYQAADAGSAEALVGLGTMAADRGAIAEAREWFRRAADAGSSEGMVALAWTQVDSAEQAEGEMWFLRAAGLGDTAGMVGAGVISLAQGNAGQAEHWFRRAADMGDTDGMARLGLVLLDREADDEAARWLEPAARAGDVNGMAGLGAVCAGRGDPQGARAWYVRAVEAGHTQAMVLLGALALDRDDLAEADDWYRRATEAGESGGLVGLGAVAIHRNDLNSAEYWCRRAVEAGDAEAYGGLGLIAEMRDDLPAAAGWYQQAAAAGDPDAAQRLAELYQESAPAVYETEWVPGPSYPQAGAANDASYFFDGYDT